MTSEAYNYDDITSGSDQIATTSATIASGQVLPKFTPIGQVTATARFVKSDPAATDGSETPVYLTAQAVDATGGDKKSQGFKAGTFDPSMVNWHASFTAVQKQLAFVGTPISLQEKAAEL